MRLRHVLLASMLGIAALATAFLLWLNGVPVTPQPKGDQIGATIKLVENGRVPVRWIDNDTVEFAQINGYTQADLDGSTTFRRDEGALEVTHNFRPKSEPLPGSRFGSWRGIGLKNPEYSGGYLTRDRGAKTEDCRDFLVSPDGRYVACRLTTFNIVGPEEPVGIVIRIR